MRTHQAHGAVRLALPLQPQLTRHRRHRAFGFTLIELLVVIAILALLAALIVPAAGRALERARRTSCAAGLKELARTAVLSADDNEGRFPPLHSGASPYPYWYSYTYVMAWTERHGIQRSQCYCPSNKKWNKDSYWNYGGTGYDSVWGYFYLANDSNWVGRGGNTFPGAPTDGTLLFAQRTQDNPYYRVLFTDLTRKYAGSWSEGVNHPTRNGPADGCNAAQLDGSVAWTPGVAMQLRFTGPSVEGYW